MAPRPPRPPRPQVRTNTTDGQQQQGQRGLVRAMRGLQGFAGQATAAYGKLGETIQRLVPIVGDAAKAFGGLRDTLRGASAEIEQADGKLEGMRNTLATIIPLQSAINRGFIAMTKTAMMAGQSGSIAFGSMARNAGMAAASTSGGLLASLGSLLNPMTLIAAAAAVVYVAFFKWDEVPTLLKVIMLAVSPIVMAIRVLVNAVNAVLLPFRAMAGAVRLVTGTVTGMVRGVIALPGLLVSAATAAARFGASVVRNIATLAVGAFRGLRSAVGAVSAVGGVLSGVGNDVTTVAQRITAPLTDAAGKFAAAGVAAAGLAAASGLSIGAIQALGYAAEQSGASADDLARGVASANTAIAEASSGNARASATFAALGLDLAKLKAMSPDQRFAELGVAIASLADPLDRARMATEVFGSAGNALIPMFDRGAAGLQNMWGQASRLGLVMSGPQVKAAKALTEAQQLLQDSYRGLWQQLGAAVAPALTDAAKQMSVVIQAVTNWVQRNPALIDQVFRIAQRVVSVATAIGTMGSVLAVATPNLIALGAAATAGYFAWGKYGDAIQKAMGGAIGYLQDFATEATVVLDGIWAAISAGDLELAVEIAWAGALAAWSTGLTDMASLFDGAFSDILEALAAGDFASAGEQAMLALQTAFQDGLGMLDSIFVSLQNITDQTVTYVMQGVTIAVQQFAKMAMAGVDQLAKFSKMIEAYDPTGKLTSLRLDMQLAASNSGLGAAAAKDVVKENDKLQAESNKRQQDRRDELATRDEARAEKVLRLEDERRTLADAAGMDAGVATTAAQGNLAKLIARAQSAAQAAQQQQADEIERQRQLQAVARGSAAGPSIGATFSAAALMALGGGKNTVQDRTAKAAEATAAKIGDLVSLQKEAVALARVNAMVFQP